MTTELKDHPPTALYDALVESVRRTAREELLVEIREQINEKLGLDTAPPKVHRHVLRVRVKGAAPAKAARAARGSSDDNAKRVLAYVKANPGSRGEQITAALGLDRKAMVGVRRVLGGKLVTKGQRRGMTYSARKGA